MDTHGTNALETRTTTETTTTTTATTDEKFMGQKERRRSSSGKLFLGDYLNLTCEPAIQKLMTKNGTDPVPTNDLGISRVCVCLCVFR